MKLNLTKYIVFLLLLPVVSVIFAGAGILSPGVTATSDGEKRSYYLADQSRNQP